MNIDNFYWLTIGLMCGMYIGKWITILVMARHKKESKK